MGRSVKCAITGEMGTTDTFVKIGKHYYKSQEIYDEAMKQKTARKEALNIIASDFFQYETGRPFPVLINKKYQELSFYDDETILEAIKEIRNSVSEYCKYKTFDSEYGRAAYVFAAINNHVGDVYNRRQKQKKRAEQLNAQIERQEPIEVDDLNVMLTPPKRPTYSQTRDISAFL